MSRVYNEILCPISGLVELGLQRWSDGGASPCRRWVGLSRAPSPGALGPAVIAGHVTWNGAPKVFYRLGALQRGGLVTGYEDGKPPSSPSPGWPNFRSRGSRAGRFTAESSMLDYDPQSPGGTYDAVRHSYLDTMVIFTTPRLEAMRGPGS